MSNASSTRQPVRRRTNPRVVLVGRLRVPIAGPYCPWARLYRFPDGRRLWQLRLWEYDRPVAHLVATSALLHYARASGLAALEHAVVELAEEARGVAP